MKCNSIYLNFSIILFIIFGLIAITHQDLPVHCLSAQIEGDWLIHMSDNHSDKDLKCGHKRPDQNLDHYDVDVKTALKQKYEILIKLERPNKVLSIQDGSIKIGKWTMIYDEGFEFTIGDQVFFAFSKYQKVGKFSASNADTEDTPGYKNICDQTFIGWFHNSQTNENWGCYWAEKINKEFISIHNVDEIDYKNVFKLRQIMPLSGNTMNDIRNTPEVPGIENNSNNSIKQMQTRQNVHSQNKNEIKTNIKNYEKNLSSVPGFSNLVTNLANQNKEVKEAATLNSNGQNRGENSYVDFIKSLGWDGSSGGSLNNIPHLDIYFLTDISTSKGSSEFLELTEETKLFSPDFNYIKRINDPKNGYLWKAKAYDEFTGKSYSQMRNLLGNINYLKNIPGRDIEEGYSDFLELEIKLSHTENNRNFLKNTNKKSLLYDNLPKNFDWRNVDSVNYDSPIRKQGECGSCYAIAAVSVLESRIRIKSNNRLKPSLSPASIISCSRYNQGCAGGYPYLVGKHAKEFGFVDESCQPYAEKDDRCFNYCFNQQAWKAKDYGYVGGYYGGCDEESMMREIYQNGPIIVAINATPELYYYSEGVFHSEAKKSEGKLEKNVKPWEYTNHAVVCLGWGEQLVNDNVVKYWILKNSWGETWGEKGYFRLNKGTDMASVEAQGVFITPDLD